MRFNCFREDRLGSRMADDLYLFQRGQIGKQNGWAEKSSGSESDGEKDDESKGDRVKVQPCKLPKKSKCNQICKFQNVKLGNFKVPMTKEQIAVTDWLKKKVNHIIIFVFTLIISIIISIIIIIILVFIFISFALIVVIIIIKSRNQLGRAIKWCSATVSNIRWCGGEKSVALIVDLFSLTSLFHFRSSDSTAV